MRGCRCVNEDSRRRITEERGPADKELVDDCPHLIHTGGRRIDNPTRRIELSSEPLLDGMHCHRAAGAGNAGRQRDLLGTDGHAVLGIAARV